MCFSYFFLFPLTFFVSILKSECLLLRRRKPKMSNHFVELTTVHVVPGYINWILGSWALGSPGSQDKQLSEDETHAESSDFSFLLV
jgi:hypothetical protein